MPSNIIVSLKSDADPAQLESAKKSITDQGGKITNEFKLIKGFSAEIPDDKVSTFKTNDHINVEQDGKVTTQ